MIGEMCKNEMDLASTVEDAEQTWFCPRTDGWTEGKGETLSTLLKQGV